MKLIDLWASTGTKTRPTDAQIAAGWGCGPADQEWMNWVLYTLGLQIIGNVARWSADINTYGGYTHPELVTGSDGKLYRSVLGGDYSQDPVGNGGVDWIEYTLGILPPTFQSGVLLSNNTTDLVNDIDFSSGYLMSASGVVVTINSGSEIGKRLDASWLAGGTPSSTVGGRAAGVALAAGWYYCFILVKSDGTYDAGFDTSINAVNLLADPNVVSAGFTEAIYRGAIYYTGATIRRFYQLRNRFIWDVPLVDVNLVATTTVAALHTLSVPPLDTAIANLQVLMKDTNGVTDGIVKYGIITATFQTDSVPSSTLWNIGMYDEGVGNNESIQTKMDVRSGALSQIRSRFQYTTHAISIVTEGWIDQRLAA